MNTAVPNDKTRLFSRQLKQEIFSGNDTCRICTQKIASINDAALDHDTQYWQGGKTILDNARLVHRLCNLERSRKE